MHRFWIILPVALAFGAAPAVAGKLDSATQAAKTYLAKKETGGKGKTAEHGIAGLSHGKAAKLFGKGKSKIAGR